MATQAFSSDFQRQARSNLPSVLQLAAQRDITYLVHFTSIKNLPGILSHGLLQRDYLENADIDFDCYGNDALRLDGHKNSISLSILHPNEKMLYKYSLQQRDAWVVLVLDPKILWEKSCAFCPTNAAHHSVSSKSLAQLHGPAAFNAMFYEDEKRKHDRLQPCDPTDVQAEVLVFDRIDPRHIIDVVFYSQNAYSRQKALLQQFHLHGIVAPNPFFQQRSRVRPGGICRVV